MIEPGGRNGGKLTTRPTSRSLTNVRPPRWSFAAFLSTSHPPVELHGGIDRGGPAGGGRVPVAGRVSGFYTAPVVAAGTDEELPWLTTAFVPGPSLDGVVTMHGPRVMDFGVARAVAGTRLTTTGSVVGTPRFMSPEQVEGQPAGPASDIFLLRERARLRGVRDTPVQYRTGRVAHLGDVPDRPRRA